METLILILHPKSRKPDNLALMDLCHERNLSQLINEPMRYSLTGSSIIGLILADSNDSPNALAIGIFCNRRFG